MRSTSRCASGAMHSPRWPRPSGQTPPPKIRNVAHRGPPRCGSAALTSVRGPLASGRPSAPDLRPCGSMAVALPDLGDRYLPRPPRARSRRTHAAFAARPLGRFLGERCRVQPISRLGRSPLPPVQLRRRHIPLLWRPASRGARPPLPARRRATAGVHRRRSAAVRRAPSLPRLLRGGQLLRPLRLAGRGAGSVPARGVGVGHRQMGPRRACACRAQAEDPNAGDGRGRQSSGWSPGARPNPLRSRSAQDERRLARVTRRRWQIRDAAGLQPVALVSADTVQRSLQMTPRHRRSQCRPAATGLRQPIPDRWQPRPCSIVLAAPACQPSKIASQAAASSG